MYIISQYHTQRNYSDNRKLKRQFTYGIDHELQKKLVRLFNIS